MTTTQKTALITGKQYSVRQFIEWTATELAAKQKLGWTPEITAQEMCAEMVTHDLAQAKQHALLKQHGYQVNVSVE